MSKKNNAMKGALLSGAVFPGLGQIILRHRLKGVTLMLIILTSLLAMVATAVQQALGILQKLEAKGGAIDIQSISAAANQSSASDSTLFTVASWVILVCWLYAIIDAYKIGKKMDLDAQSRDQPAD